MNSRISLFDSAWSIYERFWLDSGLNPSEIKSGEEREELVDEILRVDFGEKLRRSRELLEEVCEAFKLSGMSLVLVDARLVWRGLPGSSSGLGRWVLEIGLSWDPILDLPIVPGSSVKGAARAFMEEFLERRESKSAKEICEALFGSPGEGGAVGPLKFIDALPVELGESGRLLVDDVINAHYNPELSGIETELDVRPNPVLHIALSPGATFRFIVGVDRQLASLTELSELLPEGAGSDPEDVAAFALGGALRRGLGSRTLKGYGIFKPIRAEVMK